MLEIKFPKFNFIGNRKWGFIVSGSLTFIALLSVVLHGGFNSSVDFSGGTVMQLKFQNAIAADIGKVRDLVTELGFGGAEVRTVGAAADNEIQITVKKKGEGNIIGDKIQKALQDNYSANPFEVRRTEQVGPRVSRELFRNAMIAVLLSVVAIIIYMGFRFSLPFGVAAVIALVHDIIMTLGALSLINAEFSMSMIAALLTILGYSLNDTIVVFDRVRENMAGTALRKSYDDKVNESINETLSRTVMTGSTTLLALAVMLLFFWTRNDSIRDFCLAMLVGVITGTYSSVFIASPIVVLWNKKWPIKA
jgi:preprotein translocase subunit SecF